MKTFAILVFIFLVSIRTASATPLQERWVDFALDAPIDVTGKHDSYTGGGGVLFILAKGFLEPGVEISYGKDEFKSPEGHHTYGLTYGPRMEINGTPWFHVTPFASLSYLMFGGNLNDIYKNGYGFRFGVKVFANSFASANLQGRSEHWRAENGGLNSSVHEFSIGVSFYFGKKGGSK